MSIEPGDYGVFKLHEDGILEAFGLRIIFFRIETRASIRASLLDLLGHDGGAIVLGLIGERIGKDSSKFAKEKLGLGLDEKSLLTISKIFLQSGWGKREFELKEREIIIKVYNSFEADAHLIAFGKADKPACYFVKGYLKGIFSVLAGKPVEVEETKCKARGDEYCEFIVKYRFLDYKLKELSCRNSINI